MIDDDAIFNQVHNNISLMCDDNCVGADLAAAVGFAISNKMNTICVPSQHVSDVWPWVEKTKTKIISRFSVDESITDTVISDLAKSISASFRDGANGALVFVSWCNLPNFAKEIVNIREDLFFNKTFSVGININEIGVFDWAELFGLMHMLQADSLTLVFNDDMGDKSDFVGRVFSMLNTPRGNWTGGVNFILGRNFVRIDQTFRLIQKIMPESISKTEFFIDNE